MKYLADEKRIKAVTVCFTDLEGRFHMLDYDKKFLLKSSDNLTFDGSSIRGFTVQAESDPLWVCADNASGEDGSVDIQSARYRVDNFKVHVTSSRKRGGGSPRSSENADTVIRTARFQA